MGDSYGLGLSQMGLGREVDKTEQVTPIPGVRGQRLGPGGGRYRGQRYHTPQV